jgi:hypothetical protein
MEIAGSGGDGTREREGEGVNYELGIRNYELFVIVNS